MREQYLTSVSFILNAVSVPQMQLQVIRGHFQRVVVKHNSFTSYSCSDGKDLFQKNVMHV